jgi:hypothetical protein
VSATVIVLLVLTAAGFPLLLWAIGRGVTAVGARVPSAAGHRRRYLAGRLTGVQVVAVAGGEGELLVTLAAGGADTGAAGDPLAGVFRVDGGAWSLARVARWQEEGTLLRAYLSSDGAVVLADPVLGGNAACEPAASVARPTRERAVSPDQRPPEDG